MSRPPLFQEGQDPVAALIREMTSDTAAFLAASENNQVPPRMRNRLRLLAERRKRAVASLLEEESA